MLGRHGLAAGRVRDDLHSPGGEPARAERVVGVVMGQDDVADRRRRLLAELFSTSRARTGAMKGSTRRTAFLPMTAVQFAP